MRVGNRGGWSRGVAALAVVAAMVGCATLPAPLPPGHPMNQAHVYLQERAYAHRVAKHRDAAASDKPVDQMVGRLFGSAEIKPEAPRIARPKVTERDGYRELTETYPALYRSPDFYVDTGHWGAAFREACSSQGGRLDGKFCSANADPDRVLFIVIIQRGYWSSSSWYDVTLVEPTVQPLSTAYTRAVLGAGFVTQAVHQARTRAAEAAATERAAQERARVAVDWPRMRVRGQMVCRDENGVRYVGYVEEFTEERMKVSVTRATVGSSGFSPGGFRPEVIWTRPEGWAPCEGISR